MRVERLIVAMGTLAALGFGSAVSAAVDPLDAISICSRIAKKDARLQCYDQVAQDAAAGRLGRGPATPQGFGTLPPGNAVAPPTPLPGTAPRTATFGDDSLPYNSAARAETEGPDSITAEAISSTDNGLGLWRIRMADGTIWQVTEPDTYFRPPAPHEVVTIRKAAMGSFMMDVGKQGSVRVRRLQ